MKERQTMRRRARDLGMTEEEFYRHCPAPITVDSCLALWEVILSMALRDAAVGSSVAQAWLTTKSTKAEVSIAEWAFNQFNIDRDTAIEAHQRRHHWLDSDSWRRNRPHRIRPLHELKLDILIEAIKHTRGTGT